MALSTSLPFVCSGGPIDYELRNQGRMLVIKDALYNPITQKYHDIQLVRGGWKFLGMDWGGGRAFTGITKDAVRQIQETYGIALKTLGKEPPGLAFWGDASKTTYVTEADDGASFWSSPRASYPYGQKSDDVLLSAEDAARFGWSDMTLHDAIRAGIWNATGWSSGWSQGAHAFAPEPPRVDETPNSEESAGAGKYGSAIARPPRSRAVNKGSAKRIWLTDAPGKEANVASDAAKGKPTPADRLKQKTALDADDDSGEDINNGGQEPIDGEVVEQPNGITTLNGALEPIDGEEQQNGITSLDAPKTSPNFKQIAKVPSIPVYRAASTPIIPGYDDAPVDERRSRIIEHLDRSSKVPFSAFVDNNQARRIHPVLFQTMLDALRRLALDPAANDSDAQDMKGLLKHWFRAAYHYLDQNSSPSDGYPHIFNVVSRGTKEPKEAEKKAKELYWRRQATDFWMTLIDLFSSETIDIDLLHRSISQKTSLNPWF